MCTTYVMMYDIEALKHIFSYKQFLFKCAKRITLISHIHTHTHTSIYKNTFSCGRLVLLLCTSTVS